MIKTSQLQPSPSVDRVEHTPPTGVTWHPYADLFPWIDGAAREALKADIAEHGVHEPIVFLDGAILDGRNRYTIARELGIEYPRTEYVGDDPLAFVLSKNLARRHLTESQRAMVAAKLANMDRGRPTDNSANLRNNDAAQMLNVSTRSVETARKVEREGSPELVAAVERGEVSVSAAAEVATLPKDEQVKAVADGEVKQKAKAVRAAKQAENDAYRAQNKAALPEQIKAVEDAKAKRREASALSQEDRIAELEEANKSLEKEVATLRAENKLFGEMRVEYERGGFAEVIAGKDETIRVLNSRVERESADKVSWKRSSDMWRKRAEESGWSNDITIDIASGQFVNG